MIIICECSAKLKVDDAKIPAKGARIRCPRCGAILAVRKEPLQPAPPLAPIQEAEHRCSEPSAGKNNFMVLVAHENDAVRAMINGVLSDAGYIVEEAADGVGALKKANEMRPRVIVLDVGIPGIYGFELCERLKSDEQTKEVKIILIASVYDAGRYKRPPVSLYGADDYIEKHQISDLLPLKIRKLICPEEFTSAPPPAPAEASVSAPAPQRPVPDESSRPFEFRPETLLREEDEAQLSAINDAARGGQAFRQDLQQPVSEGSTISPESISLDRSIFEKNLDEIPRVEDADPEAVEKAKRFARIIVSDIVLYNQEAAREGIINGTFFELLKDDIEEGRRLYEQRVPESIRRAGDYYQEAFDNYIAAQKRIVS